MCTAVCKCVQVRVHGVCGCVCGVAVPCALTCPLGEARHGAGEPPSQWTGLDQGHPFLSLCATILSHGKGTGTRAQGLALVPWLRCGPSPLLSQEEGRCRTRTVEDGGLHFGGGRWWVGSSQDATGASQPGLETRGTV